MLKIAFSNAAIPERGALVLTVADKQQLGPQGARLDRKLGGALKRVMSESAFTGKAEQSLTLLAPGRSQLTRILLIGIGDPTKATATILERIGGAAFASLTGKDGQATLVMDAHEKLAVPAATAAASLASGAKLRSYRFDKYRTKLKPDQKPQLRTLTVNTPGAAEAKQAFASYDAIANAVCFARDLVTEPPNVIYPASLAEACKSLTALGVKVDVLDEKQMAKLGMGALLGVAQGSAFPARLVSMSWLGDPAASDKRPTVFVGKGVTFDSGGLSLKPSAGMEEMKYDMGGSAAVIGALMAIAGRKAKANVIGIVGLVENMPSDRAQRPGDVVTSMSGQTIEVLNTDAEGRLVLADALWYAQETFNPRCIVDLATLTGAIIAALGHEYGGLFSNDDTLSAQLTAAGQAVEEPLWRFPLGDAYDKGIDTPIADMKNMGPRGEAGSIIGAVFLQRFIKKNMPWAHLDIAGMAWAYREKPICPKGATAYGVRLLDRLVQDAEAAPH